MSAYIIRRLLLVVPTLFGIMVINFVVVQFVPGGPVEQMIAQLTGDAVSSTARIGGESTREVSSSKPGLGGGSDNASRYRGGQGLSPELIQKIEQQFGLDKPAHERFLLMIGNYARFDFGDSYFQDRSVAQLVIDKMPVSISLGLWTTLLVYLISIPLGVAKAVRDGSRFDVWTSGLVVFGNAVPRYRQITDYFWHLTLPLLSMVVGGFASLTMLTKNSFIEEINKQYVVTARAKGLTQRRTLYGHVFRNAMLIVIAGFPSAFVGVLFTGALLTEVIFSLDGLGLLGFEAALTRDYPVMFGTLFLFTLLGLVMGIISDVMYHLVDPRIDFDTRET
jgi:microcin C transport system permease protein